MMDTVSLTCKYCKCGWHGLMCRNCWACATSCEAPTVITSENIELGEN